ncbi:gluconate 2-dehydrogenase subunit 3 family protein [Paraglaciecola aquimarina]|uniref:Gluconate 2-dehydrogenase subunit 3 family protein n=1 Tax=Paraglaciecola algarum TaxID=3050085 RepID=A0ABS9D3N3_9ALTE|nr:gluconate 2-dehydrogenase subunit 3 family protein [Paraglaciecola sp. G1-23]MCF2947534.1 gluconate 2-dehydrogenase subunit 3 family protein [Paraglaciecola sp. G1-23]
MQKQDIQQKNNQSLTDKTKVGLTRRELLVGIMASVGVVSTMGCVDNFEKSISSPAADSPSKQDDLQFYSQEQFELISVLADLIIPNTDTLGALAVGVPAMMDTLYAQWASESSKEKHTKEITQVSTGLNDLLSEDFLAAPSDKQIEILSNYDQQAFSSNWDQTWAYRAIKSLIAQFYYLSEVGATKELRYELVPGRWEACVPFEKIGRTWAA